VPFRVSRPRNAALGPVIAALSSLPTTTTKEQEPNDPSSFFTVTVSVYDPDAIPSGFHSTVEPLASFESSVPWVIKPPASAFHRYCNNCGSGAFTRTVAFTASCGPTTGCSRLQTISRVWLVERSWAAAIPAQITKPRI